MTSSPPLRRTLIALLAAVLLAGCGTDDGETVVPAGNASRTFPVTGRAADGERYRLTPGRPSPGDDVDSSWCLRLTYTGGIVIVDDAGRRDVFTNDFGTCGPDPAPALSGAGVVNCDAGTVYVFGQARHEAGGVILQTSGGARVAARRGPPAPDSGFDGFSYVATVRLNRLPATIRAATSGKVATYLPNRDAICGQAPKGLGGFNPSFSFP